MEDEKIMEESSRKVYLDYLRVLATLAVITLHVAAQNWYSVGVETFSWKVFNFYDSIVRWTVPVFVMISGALFLDREQSIEKIYKKYIKRIIIAFVLWSAAYASARFVFVHRSIMHFAVDFIRGHYHMWFLFMIVGLYIIVPFLRRIVEDAVLTRYFLIVSLVFTFVIPQIIELISIKYEKLGSAASGVFDQVNFHFTLGYVCYFVGGYYLSKVDLSPKIRRIIYFLGACGFVSTIVLTNAISLFKNEANEFFYGNLTLNVMLESLVVFVFIKYAVGQRNDMGGGTAVYL